MLKYYNGNKKKQNLTGHLLEQIHLTEEEMGVHTSSTICPRKFNCTGGDNGARYVNSKC
jgi:hypothetical protein